MFVEYVFSREGALEPVAKQMQRVRFGDVDGRTEDPGLRNRHALASDEDRGDVLLEQDVADG